MIALMWVVGVVMYVLNGIAFMKLAELAGRQDIGWMAWVPIANVIQQLLLIKKSGWNIFWLLCPIANIVFAIIWQVKLLNAYGKSGAFWLFNLIPYAGSLVYYILWIVWGFSENTRYALPIEQSTQNNFGA